MKSVLPGRTLGTQELQRRLTQIADAIRSQPHERAAFAERLQLDVILPLGSPRRRDEQKLLAEAEILRAICLASLPTPRTDEAGEALLSAAAVAAELPPSPRRTRAFISTAARLRKQCRQVGQLEMEARVTAVLLSGWQVEGPANDVLRRVLAALPFLVRQMRNERLDGGVLSLVHEARHFFGVPGVASILRDLEREAAKLWLHQDKPELILQLARHPELLSAEEDLQLTIALAEANLLDRFAHDQYIRVIAGEPESRLLLAHPVQRLARIGLETRAMEITLKESLNEALLPWYGSQGWPYVHLAIGAARRGEDERALACFLVAFELSADAEGALPVLVGSLCALGFDVTAQAVLAEIEPSLNDVVIREVVSALAETEDLLGATFDEERAGALARFFEQISHPLLNLPGLAVRIHRARSRICARLGLHQAALTSLDQALSQRPADPEIAIEVAECCIAAEQFARARAILDQGTALRSRRVLIANARLALAHKDEELALSCLEAALEQPEQAIDRCGLLVENLRGVFETHASLEGRGRASGPLAKQLLEEVDRVCAVQSKDGDREQRMILEAAALAARTGQPAREAALLERLKKPGPAVLFRIVRAQLAAGMVDAARRTLGVVDTASRTTSEAQLLRGLCAMGAREFDLAREILHGINPEVPEAILGRAWLAVHDGDRALAGTILDELPIDLEPGHAALDQSLRSALGLPPRQGSAVLAPEGADEPSGEVIEHARKARLKDLLSRLDKGGAPLDVESALEALYRESARAADHAVAHEALLHLTRLRDEARVQRDGAKKDLVRSRFEARRFRAVVALTGGPTPDSDLPIETFALRLRALAEVGGLERAWREFRRLKRDANKLGLAARRELNRAHEALVLARALREKNETVSAAITAYQRGELEECRILAEKASRLSPRSAIARYVLALASRGAGSETTLRTLAADALTAAEDCEDVELQDLSRELLAMPWQEGSDA